MKLLTNLFALAGLMAVTGFLAGAMLDYRAFDRTKGGYEPPYAGVTGEPVDWQRMDLTATGLVNRGYVVNTHVHGTTGMITFEIFRQQIEFRRLSERAIVVHKAREGLVARGFSPQF